MTPIETVLLHAIAQDGDRYVLGAEVPVTAEDATRWDCSELVEWSCGRAGVVPRMPDGAHWQLAHCQKYGTVLGSIAEGIATRGALLFVDYGAAGGGGRGNHVAFSLGDGTTIEARGTKWGVGMWPAPGRSWTHAARIPGCDYVPAPPPFPIPPIEEVALPRDTDIVAGLPTGDPIIHPGLIPELRVRRNGDLEAVNGAFHGRAMPPTLAQVGVNRADIARVSVAERDTEGRVTRITLHVDELLFDEGLGWWSPTFTLP